MHKVPLTAAKALTYGTRRLRAGDAFEASPQDARVLVAVGLARDAVKPARKPSAPATVRPVPPISESEIAGLRHQYEIATGRKPNMRWGLPRLKAEISEVFNGGGSGGGSEA